MMQDNSGSGNPLANVAAPPQPQGAQPQQGGNPLARLSPQLGGAPQQQPVPNRAQTTAAVKRFSAIQNALREVMQDKDFGKANVRPAVLDAGSKLLGAKILSLPELMNELGSLPEQPLEQKAFVERLYNQAQQAEASVLDHHGSAIVAGKLPPDGGPQYNAGDHDQHMQGLLAHYKR